MYSDDIPELAQAEGGTAPAEATAKPKPKRVRKPKAKKAKAPKSKSKAKAKKPAKVKAPKKAKAAKKPKAEKKPAATAPTQGKDVFAIKAGGQYVRAWKANHEGVFLTFTDKTASAMRFEPIDRARVVLSACKLLGSEMAAHGRVVRLVEVDGIARLPKRGRPAKITSA